MTEATIRGVPGMKSVLDMPVMQDGPPPGGYPSVRYARRIPSTGPSGFALFGAYCAAAVYGFYQIGQGNKHRRKVLDEKHNARAILVPFLQAEEDRRYVRDFRELKEREKTVMKNVRGWNPEEKTYKTTWLSPGAATRPGLI